MSDLVKSYGDVVALEVEELVVPAGQSVVLVGHNGSGKSTLLNLIAGTLEPSEGGVQGARPRARLGRGTRRSAPGCPTPRCSTTT